jgi:uncharacterized protein (TIGR02996 family)
MTDGDALYQAILAAPDDDAPRLVWADWLDEHGQPDRAEFVRLQCELANLDPGDRRIDELTEQFGRLTVNREAWTAGLGPYARNCGFWRGLPDWFELSTGRLVAALTELRRQVPAQCLSLTLSGGGHPELSNWVGLEPIRCLNVTEADADPFYPESSLPGWVWLIHSSRLRGLRSFRADMVDTSVGFISALRGTDWPDLRELGLRIRPAPLREPPPTPWQERPPPPWQDLAEAPWFPKLRSLDVRDCRLGDDGLDRLLGGSPPLALTRLNLGANDLTPTGVRRLASSRALARLRRLALGQNDVGTAAADLLRSPALPDLCSLDVSYCDGYGTRSGPDVLGAIAAAAPPGRLRVLEANVCHCSVRSLARLVWSAVVSRLEALSLNGNDLPDEAAAAIAESPQVGALRRLDLADNRITDAGLRFLMRSPHFGALRVLNLRGNDLTAEGRRDAEISDLGRRLWRMET